MFLYPFITSHVHISHVFFIWSSVGWEIWRLYPIVIIKDGSYVAIQSLYFMNPVRTFPNQSQNTLLRNRKQDRKENTQNKRQEHA